MCQVDVCYGFWGVFGEVFRGRRGGVVGGVLLGGVGEVFGGCWGGVGFLNMALHNIKCSKHYSFSTEKGGVRCNHPSFL